MFTITKRLKNILMALVVVLPLGNAALAADTLYIGDAGQADIKKFNADTNAYLGAITGTNCFGPGGPFGGDATGYWNPRTSGPCQAFGMVMRGNTLIVSNGNNGVYLYGTPYVNVSGDVMEFLVSNGKAKAKLVSPTDRNGSVNFDAPYSPRGTLFWRGNVYVADMAELDRNDPTADCDSFYAGPCKPGSIKVYNPGTGRLVKKLLPDETFPNIEYFHPRGIVIKDGLLYASVRKLPNDDDANHGGYVVRFDLATGEFKDVFIASSGICHPGAPVADCANQTERLNRPEGIVFGPDGNIYVASFRYDANDNDRIMIFNGVTGAYVDNIDLALPENTPAKRAYAQALLFGPNGRLIVPITAGSDLSGEVRRYDVGNPAHPYTVIIPSNATGGPLGNGWNLTYGRTDPATLDYTR